MAVQFSTSPNVCFCTTQGNQIKRNMRWNKQEAWKNIPDIINRNLKKDWQIFNIFGRRISDITGY